MSSAGRTAPVDTSAVDPEDGTRHTRVCPPGEGDSTKVDISSLVLEEDVGEGGPEWTDSMSLRGSGRTVGDGTPGRVQAPLLTPPPGFSVKSPTGWARG